MEFINPVWLISLISIPIVIFFLFISKKPRKMVVPSLLIWKKIAKIEKLSQSKKSRIDLFTLLIVVVLVFISLSVANLSLTFAKEKNLNVRIFIDDSELMKNITSEGKSAFEFCHDTLFNRICTKVTKTAQFSVYLPIINVHKQSLDRSQLKGYLDTIKAAGFLNYQDYSSKLNSFIHEFSQDSNSIGVIFTPFQVNKEIIGNLNITVINPPFAEIPIFPEYIGFDNNSILLRLNRKANEKNMLKLIDENGIVTNTDCMGKNAVVLDNFSDKYGLFTTDGRICRYFAESEVYKIGAIGLEVEFIKFFNKIVNKVKFVNFSEFSDKNDIDAWVVAKNTDIPELYNKPIIYFAGVNDKKWFNLNDSIKNIDSLKIVNSELMKSVSISELDFSEAQQIEMLTAEWVEKAILADSNILVGILARDNAMRAIINSRLYDYKNTSLLIMVLNLLQYMSGEKLINRDKYCIYTIEDIILNVSKKFNQSKTDEIKMKIRKHANNEWMEKTIFITDRKTMNEFIIQLNTGAIISINQKQYAVNPEISDITDKITKIESVNIEEDIKNIAKNTSVKKQKTYYELILI
ncbi:MAG: BatA domain-containing protein, partial [Planctomycetes bacterium]|nr:BatA domain-containing protein [Planctomycetota bacterium]